jgi:hypothetical protein
MSVKGNAVLLAVLINPVFLAVAAAIGFACCRSAGIDPHGREMSMALVVFMIASQIAVVPVIFRRSGTAMGLTQSALIGLVVHLLVAVGLSLGVMVLLKINAAFAYWTLVFYWATLCGLAIIFIRAVRAVTRTPGANV